MVVVEVEERKQEAMRDQEATVKADQILQKNSKTAYNRALKTLLPESRDWWLEQLESGEIEATSADLRKIIIHNDLLPFYRSQLASSHHHEAIKQQVIGEGINLLVLANLSRYETYLDRKFERTLAMLLKLKELTCGE